MVQYDQLYMILLCIETGLYAVLFVFTLSRTIKSFSSDLSEKTVIALYFVILASVGLLLLMACLMLIQLLVYNQIDLNLIIMINVFNILLDAIIIFIFAYFWKKTNDILQTQIQQSVTEPQTRLKFEICLIVISSVVYLAYFLYVLIANPESIVFIYIVYYLCQGLSAIIILWAIVTQLIYGYALGQTLKRYQRLIGINMDKTRFRFVYWTTTIFTTTRLIFLIIATIALSIVALNSSYQWWAVYIYTITGLLPLTLYNVSFKLESAQNDSTLLQTASIGQANRSSSQSHQETELSEQVRQSF